MTARATKEDEQSPTEMAQNTRLKEETDMYLEPFEELTLARLADYERLVNRLLLEREAKAANAECRARNPQPNRRSLPWSVGWHRHGATN